MAADPWDDTAPQEDAARLEESMKEMMEEQLDEDQLIEQRRKERQAIMAKHQQAGICLNVFVA